MVLSARDRDRKTMKHLCSTHWPLGIYILYRRGMLYDFAENSIV